MEVVFALRGWGLIFGGAYTLRGLFSEFYGSFLINPDKTKLLLIGSHQMLRNVVADLDLHVTLLGKELRPVSFCKGPWSAYGCYIEL